MARLSAAFEVYDTLTRQYGKEVFKLDFCYLALQASSMARHVAMKDKVQYLARCKILHARDIQDFLANKDNAYNADVLDAAYVPGQTDSA